jgi:AraC family transcriptional regulator
VYQPNVNLPKHSHPTAYFSFVLQGTYTEKFRKESRRCSPSTLIFHPAEETHANCFQTATRGFNLQMEARWLERARAYSAITNSPAVFQGDFPLHLIMRLYKEFCNLDDLSPLIVEGLTLEILGEAARHLKKRSENSPPPWLVKTRELLNDRFQENFTLAQITESVGVHATHLSREFRRFYGCTVGEYVRRLRIEFACRRLLFSDVSLTEIALSAGFFDQSHFARTFKSQTGMTPLAYRIKFRFR